MMFKSVFFALEQAQFNHDIIHKVNTESRALSVAYERLLKKEKINCNFTRLVITGVNDTEVAINQGVNTANILSLSISFDEQKYVAFQTIRQRQEYLYTLFEAVFSKLTSEMEVNLKPFILETKLAANFSQKVIEEFRENNYQTTYLLKRKKVTAINRFCEVWVQFTEKECNLKLRIMDKKNVMEERVIYTTDPYLVAFQFPFSNVEVTNRTIQITGARNGLLKIDL
ncbi:hypothetical protein AK24_09905 [Listeria monocytogenes]|nr:hypothetical protein [Listeria monocytogenes]